LVEPGDDREERIKALKEQISSLKQKQKEDQVERVKALKERAETIKQLEIEEQIERRKVILEEVEARRQKQREARKERTGLLGQIADKIDEAQDAHIEAHLRDMDNISRRPRMHDERRDRSDFFQGPGDQDIRKGFLRLHILFILRDGPTHGYEIMHRMGHHAGQHGWHPSPGSLYPALESLGSKGYISCQGDGRRKVYALTDKGEAVISEILKKREEQFLEMKTYMSKLFDE
jgi:DNA-binding PadR family transcriptional regulator